jgi:uncharacterized membrane protein YhaH (DUF805 family)
MAVMVPCLAIALAGFMLIWASPFLAIASWSLAILLFLVVSIPLGVKRLHDMGLTGWLLLLNVVPGVNSLFPFALYLLPGNGGANRYGPPTPADSRGVQIAVACWLALIAITSVVIMIENPSYVGQGQWVRTKSKGLALSA